MRGLAQHNRSSEKLFAVLMRGTLNVMLWEGPGLDY